MSAEYLTVHNTDNDASAANEIAYMARNLKSTSYHFAVDGKEVIQAIPLDRNAWHAGDGSKGKGNRKSIGIEICYSLSGGDRYYKSEANAVKLIAQLLVGFGWDIDRVKQHHDWSGKNCPSRIRKEGRWSSFLEEIQKTMKLLSGWVAGAIGRKYYKNGVAQKGWIVDGDYWYYLDTESDVMVSGWLKWDNRWWYLKPTGEMIANEWLRYKDNWFWLKSNGQMAASEWVAWNDKWYYLDQEGIMMDNRWRLIDGNWYYFNAGGSMLIGWLEWNRKKYYLNEHGAMVTGKQQIDGKSYDFDAEGALVEEIKTPTS